MSPAPPLKVETLSPLEAKIQFIAKAIHDRHPAIRRCPISHVLKKLRTITNKFPASERIELLSSIDRNHQGMCDSEQWAKDAGEFAKGLDNWLAPSKDYWAQPPPEKHRTLSKSEQSLVSAAQIFESGIMNIGGRKQ